MLVEAVFCHLSRMQSCYWQVLMGKLMACPNSALTVPQPINSISQLPRGGSYNSTQTVITRLFKSPLIQWIIVTLSITLCWLCACPSLSKAPWSNVATKSTKKLNRKPYLQSLVSLNRHEFQKIASGYLFCYFCCCAWIKHKVTNKQKTVSRVDVSIHCFS